MAEYSMQDKLILNRTAALCREYRFYESRRDIVQTAGLPPETAKLSISELRQIIDSRIANKVTPPVVGYEHFRYKLNEHPKAVDKVRLLNRMLKNKKNPLPAPNYAEEIKRQISTEGIRTINEELKKTKSAAEKIRLNEEKIYLIDNSGWSRSQRFLAKNQTYNALYGIHSQIGNDNKAAQALEKCTRFFSAYQKTLQFNPEYRRRQAYEEWEYK